MQEVCFNENEKKCQVYDNKLQSKVNGLSRNLLILDATSFFVFVLNDNEIMSSFAHPHVIPNLCDFFFFFRTGK